jgi:hypothetical protein
MWRERLGWRPPPQRGGDPPRELHAAIAVMGSLLAAAVAHLLAQVLTAGEIHGKLDKIKMLLGVAASGCGGLVVYFVICALTGVREVRFVTGFAGKIKRRMAR